MPEGHDGRQASACCKAGSARAAIPRAASASSSSTTARAWATCRSSPTATLPNYETEIKQLTAGCSVTVEGEVKASPGKGQATEVHATQIIVHGWADPETYPLQKKRHSFEFLRTIAHLRPRTNTFGADRPRAELRLPLDPRFLPGARASSTSTRRSSPPATAKGPGEMFRSRRSTWPSCPKTARKVDYTQDFFDRPAYLTVSGQLEGRDLRLLRWARSTRSARRFAPRTRNTSRHLAEFWMVEPEMAFYELTDNMDLAEAVSEAHLPRRAGPLPRGHAVLQRADRQDGASRRSSTIVDSEFVRVCRTPRRSRS